MSEDRNKPGIFFWSATAIAVLLVLYPLSFGPYLWFHWRFEDVEPDWLDKATDIIFAPMQWTCQQEMPPCTWYNGYLDWWIEMAVNPHA